MHVAHDYKIGLILGIVLYTFLFIVSYNNPFFWDTVQLASKHAHFYYESNLKFQFLPNDLDSGHIPTLGYVLACLWYLFSKSLWVGHAFIFIFSIGIVYQAYLIIKKFVEPNYQMLALLVFLFDPTLMAQCTLVSPDILILFFLLLGVNAAYCQNRS